MTKLGDLVAAASPGPWAVTDRNDAGNFYVHYAGGPEWVLIAGPGPLFSATAEPNAQLAAQAPALAALLDQAREALERADHAGSVSKVLAAIEAFEAEL